MEFTISKWNELTTQIGERFYLNNQELEKLKKNNVAKLITAIPFFANCDNSQQTAQDHLNTYMIAKSPEYKKNYLHTPKDDKSFLTRLEPISKFKGGFSSIIERGMNLLALISLEDHKADMEMDRKNNKYNPLLSGAWNYDVSKKVLMTSIGRVPCSAMDRIVNFQGEIQGWWKDS